MCNKCKTNSPVQIKTNCLEITFAVSPTKSGKWKRSSDFSVTELFDPDNYEKNKYTAICSRCGSQVVLSEQVVTKACAGCSSTEIYRCDYNDMYFCLNCASNSLRYCRTCPLRANCELGGLNVDRNS